MMATLSDRLREAATVLDETYHQAKIEAVMLEAADALDAASSRPDREQAHVCQECGMYSGAMVPTEDK